jgi:hypothetical protein
MDHLIDAQTQLLEMVRTKYGAAHLLPAVACRFQIYQDYQLLDDDFDDVFCKLSATMTQLRGAISQTTNYFKTPGLQAEWSLPCPGFKLSGAAKTMIACYRRKNALRIEHRWENLILQTVAQSNLHDLKVGLIQLGEHSQGYLEDVHYISLKQLPKLAVSPQNLKTILHQTYGVRQFNDRIKEFIRQICIGREYDPVLARAKTGERIKSWDLNHKLAHTSFGILEARHPKKSNGENEVRFLYRLRTNWLERAKNAPTHFWPK